jgi:hypothetical protein
MVVRQAFCQLRQLQHHVQEHAGQLPGRQQEAPFLELIDACGKVLQRTCEAVALILLIDTAEALRVREEAVASAKELSPLPIEGPAHRWYNQQDVGNAWPVSLAKRLSALLAILMMSL